MTIIHGFILAAVISIILWGVTMSRISTLLASVQAQTTVIAGFIAYSAGIAAENQRLQQDLRQALADDDKQAALGTLDEMAALETEVAAQRDQLAKGFAVGTDAASEVSEDEGGIGTSDTVVDPATVELEEPAPVEEVDEQAGEGNRVEDGATGQGGGTGQEGEAQTRSE